MDKGNIYGQSEPHRAASFSTNSHTRIPHQQDTHKYSCTQNKMLAWYHLVWNVQHSTQHIQFEHLFHFPWLKQRHVYKASHFHVTESSSVIFDTVLWVQNIREVANSSSWHDHNTTCSNHRRSDIVPFCNSHSFLTSLPLFVLSYLALASISHYISVEVVLN